ncbi:MAG: hypothetical protein K5931_03495 [Lachnospiraceae bacterium]|nr:hypothetical protein [Lachnospiraceae bacterium]
MSPNTSAEKMNYDNITKMYFMTSVSLILIEIVGVVAVLIDGIITSYFIGIDAYAGIKLLSPFTSILSVAGGFLSTGSSIICSKLVGEGEKDKANQVINLAAFLGFAFSIIFIILSILNPDALLILCGVNLGKYPELNTFMYSYLAGFIIGIPAFILVNILGPIIVMDSGEKIFMFSSGVLCVTDIVADLLNIFVFKGGTFGMGLATSISYIIQFLIIFSYFAFKSKYFKLSLKFISFKNIADLCKNGTPAFIKKIAGAFRDVALNYINIVFALTYAAIAARGIQSDIFSLLFCISTGLGRSLITMVGMYYGARDLKGLKTLYLAAFKIGMIMSGAAGIISFITAPLLSQIYSSDPKVASLAVFSIRWMSVGLLCDTIIVIIQHYLQGTDNVKIANILSFSERFIIPSIAGLVLGLLFGSKGVLASVAVGKIVLLTVIFIVICFKCKGFPKSLKDIMFLPEGFGGDENDNLYAVIHSKEDAIEQSRLTLEFCRDHNVSDTVCKYMSLFVEEMAINIFEANSESSTDGISVDFRVHIENDKAYIYLMDLQKQFDPTSFYELNKDNKKYIGIRMVKGLADEMRYFNTFNSNNLVISMNI